MDFTLVNNFLNTKIIMETIRLELTKKHFKGTKFNSYGKCAIEKASTGIFNAETFEFGDYLVVNPSYNVYDKYKHEHYTLKDFTEDQAKANQAKDGEVIRVINLKKC
jgi:hypothetical protein